MALEPVVVRFAADASQFTAGVQQAMAALGRLGPIIEAQTKAMQSLEASMKSAGSSAASSSSGLANRATGVAAAGAAAAAAAVGVAALGTKIIEMGNEVDPAGALEWAKSVGKFEDAAANAAAALAREL